MSQPSSTILALLICCGGGETFVDCYYVVVSQVESKMSCQGGFLYKRLNS